MPTVFVPSLMRELTGGQERVVVEGVNVRQIVNNLDAAYPGMKARLVDGDRIIPGMAVIVNGEVSRLGLLQRVSEENEIHFLPAIAAGAGCRQARNGEVASAESEGRSVGMHPPTAFVLRFILLAVVPGKHTRLQAFIKFH